MGKKEPVIPADKLALYDKLVATYPEVERKGVSMPYTAANGHMFSIMSKDGRLGIRLDKAAREEFEQKYGASVFKNYGAVMKDYVQIPEELLQNTAGLRPYLLRGHEYVLSLEPKPTTGKK